MKLVPWHRFCHPPKETISTDIVSKAELARKAGVDVQTISRVAEVQDDPEITAALREGKMSTREAVRERQRKVEQKAEKFQPQKDFYKMSADVASTITWLRDIIRRDWESGLRMGKMDIKGHAPRIIKYIDEAIERLERFKKMLEEALDNG